MHRISFPSGNIGVLGRDKLDRSARTGMYWDGFLVLACSKNSEQGNELPCYYQLKLIRCQIAFESIARAASRYDVFIFVFAFPR